MRYQIISVSRNAAPWLPACLASIAAQTGQPFDVCVIDDASDDGSDEIIRDFAEERGWAYHLNTKCQGALANQCLAFDSLAPADDDVVVIVDGDDRLAHPGVLDRLQLAYANPAVQLTYGSYRPDPPSESCPMARPYPAEVVRARSFRTGMYSVGLLYNHLRTFRAGAFRTLDREMRFKWPNGEWFDCCTDSAVMLPLLEVAGENHRFIPDVLYIYSSANPTSDWRERPGRIDATHKYIWGLPPMSR